MLYSYVCKPSISIKTGRRLLHLNHRLRSHRKLLRAKKRRSTRLETCVDEDGGVSIWGIPLLSDERSDVLLKFLRVRGFKVKEAFTMLINVVAWRKEFGIESLLEEDLGTEQDN